MAVVCEVTSAKAIEAAVKYVDMLQIGARNMQNFELLKEAGKTGLPVLLKRGLSSTIDEWLNAAEYIIAEGNYNVVLCERGIRTYETATRNTLDLSAVPVIRAKSHLPIIVDPSHATGVRAYVAPLAKAAVAAGADGLMIETHPCPERALSDGPQSLTFDQFQELCTELRPYAALAGRTFLGRSRYLMKTIGFIGFGLIGGSIAKSIRKAHPDYKLAAYSRTRSSLEQALEDHTIDEIWDQVDASFSSCDYVFLCTPVSFNADYSGKAEAIDKKRVYHNGCGQYQGKYPSSGDPPVHGRLLHRRPSHGRFRTDRLCSFQ